MNQESKSKTISGTELNTLNNNARLYMIDQRINIIKKIVKRVRIVR